MAHYRFPERPVQAVQPQTFSLGFVPGAVIDIVRFAPLGDPAEVRIRHTSYALRKSELAMLRLEPVNGGEGA